VVVVPVQVTGGKTAFASACIPPPPPAVTNRHARTADRRGGRGRLGDCVRDAEMGVLRTQAAVANGQQAAFASYARLHADTSCAVANSGHSLGQDQPGIATVPVGLSALSAFCLGLEPFRKDDGGAGGGAPAQGPEEVSGPDQAPLVDLVPRIPESVVNPGPEAVQLKNSARAARVLVSADGRGWCPRPRAVLPGRHE
jgi:hypothetical protein